MQFPEKTEKMIRAIVFIQIDIRASLMKQRKSLVFIQGPMLLKKLVTRQSLTVTFCSFDCPTANMTKAM